MGIDSILKLKGVLTELNSKKIFLVTGNKSYFVCGACTCMDRLLRNCDVNRFYEFSVNPKIEDIDRGIDILKAASCDTVIAIGGGSVIDMAKAINFLAVQQLILGGREVGNKTSDATIRPLVAIPTTSGSGSEATHFAVVYVDNRKYSISDASILPSAAIVDANLTMSLPRRVTAVSGLDALGQAIESFWSIHSSEESKRLAKDAIQLILPNIKETVKKPTRAARQAMSMGAHLAGKAINITKTTAAHSISYPLTSYFGIAHGHAVGLTLPSLLEYNAQVTEKDVLDPRGISYVQKTISEIAELIGAHSIGEAKSRLEQLVGEIGLETRLAELGIKSESDVELIIRNGFNSERAGNNPRFLTEDALRTMLYNIG